MTTECRNVRVFKGIAKDVDGGPNYRVLLQGLEKVKDHCNTCVDLRENYVEQKS